MLLTHQDQSRPAEPTDRHQVPRRAPTEASRAKSDLGTPIGSARWPLPIRVVRDVIGLQRLIGNRQISALLQRRPSLQRLGSPLNAPVRATDPTPIAETPGAQRKYTPAQYIAMWEKEQGRSLTPEEKKTLERGCIGLTAVNLNGKGNPPLDVTFSTFDQAHQVMAERNRTLEWMAKIPFLAVHDARYVVFAKLFWSNQNVDETRRTRSNPTAFRPDTTGRVDMGDYKYRSQPGFVNFDYGFWDEASQSFWHANHMETNDPNDPMIVLQSTKEKFATRFMMGAETRYGYPDFDRVVYGVALASNYNPALAAAAAARP